MNLKSIPLFLATLLLSAVTAFAQAQQLPDDYYRGICKNKDAKAQHECEAMKAKVYHECTTKNMYVGGYSPTCIDDGMLNILSPSLGKLIPKERMIGNTAHGATPSSSMTFDPKKGVATGSPVNVAPSVSALNELTVGGTFSSQPKQVERISPEQTREFRTKGAEVAVRTLLQVLTEGTPEYEANLNSLNKQLAVLGMTLDEFKMRDQQERIETERRSNKALFPRWLHWLYID